jgi:excisionase family DNA binding protein
MERHVVEAPTGIPLLLTAREVEASLQLGRTRTYALLRSGEIPVLRVGRAIRVSRLALEKWVEERSAAPYADPPGREGPAAAGAPLPSHPWR